MNQGGVNEPDEVSPEALKVADGTLATHRDYPVAALRRDEHQHAGVAITATSPP